jgi:YidC/Oxa1 family membrane protein insertase
MLLASTLGQIAHPFYLAFAWLMAAFYAAIPNYAIAIGLLTLVVMVVVFPITRRGTRSMMRMQLLAPEMKKLQAKYKSPPGTPPAERNANRQALNEEMMALYKENGVSPTGGCLPMFLQFPIFLILYGTIEGLVHRRRGGVPDPLYISHTSRMYHDIIHAHGKLMAFGLNLGDNALTHGLSPWGRAPYIGLILVALVLQYIQLRQMSGRNPAAQQANPQMQQMQKIMPLIFAVIYIRISAGVNVYFVVSSLFRIAQQEYMYRHDPDLRESLDKLRARAAENPKVAEAKEKILAERGRSGLLGRLMPSLALSPREVPAAEESKVPPKAPGKAERPAPRQQPARKAGTKGGDAGKPSKPSGSVRGRSGPGAPSAARATGTSGQPSSGQRGSGRQEPRPQGKRPRRPH